MLHLPFSLLRQLVRIFRTIVAVAVLAMFHGGRELLLGRSVALELIGHNHAGHVYEPL
jgi:hypothetical protein